MARSLDDVQNEQAMQDNKGQEVSNEDVEIAFRMAVQMLNSGGGMQVIRDAMNGSQDPAQVIGQFLAQLMGQLAEQLQGQVNLDPRVFLAKNGWLDLMLDYIESELGLPSEFSDQVYGEVLETIKAAAANPAPNSAMDPNAQGELPQEAPPAPAPNLPGQGQPPLPGGM